MADAPRTEDEAVAQEAYIVLTPTSACSSFVTGKRFTRQQLLDGVQFGRHFKDPNSADAHLNFGTYDTRVMSKEHAKMFLRDNQLILKDCCSRNGTQLKLASSTKPGPVLDVREDPAMFYDSARYQAEGHFRLGSGDCHVLQEGDVIGFGASKLDPETGVTHHPAIITISLSAAARDELRGRREGSRGLIKGHFPEIVAGRQSGDGGRVPSGRFGLNLLDVDLSESDEEPATSQPALSQFQAGRSFGIAAAVGDPIWANHSVGQESLLGSPILNNRSIVFSVPNSPRTSFEAAPPASPDVQIIEPSQAMDSGNVPKRVVPGGGAMFWDDAVQVDDDEDEEDDNKQVNVPATQFATFLRDGSPLEEDIRNEGPDILSIYGRRVTQQVDLVDNVGAELKNSMGSNAPPVPGFYPFPSSQARNSGRSDVDESEDDYGFGREILSDGEDEQSNYRALMHPAQELTVAGVEQGENWLYGTAGLMRSDLIDGLMMPEPERMEIAVCGDPEEAREDAEQTSHKDSEEEEYDEEQDEEESESEPEFVIQTPKKPIYNRESSPVNVEDSASEYDEVEPSGSGSEEEGMEDDVPFTHASAPRVRSPSSSPAIPGSPALLFGDSGDEDMYASTLDRIRKSKPIGVPALGAACIICDKVPSHSQAQCPVILGGPKTVNKRMREMKKARMEGNPRFDRGIVALEKWSGKREEWKAKMLKIKGVASPATRRGHRAMVDDRSTHHPSSDRKRGHGHHHHHHIKSSLYKLTPPHIASFKKSRFDASPSPKKFKARRSEGRRGDDISRKSRGGAGRWKRSRHRAAVNKEVTDDDPKHTISGYKRKRSVSVSSESSQSSLSSTSSQSSDSSTASNSSDGSHDSESSSRSDSDSGSQSLTVESVRAERLAITVSDDSDSDEEDDEEPIAVIAKPAMISRAISAAQAEERAIAPLPNARTLKEAVEELEKLKAEVEQLKEAEGDILTHDNFEVESVGPAQPSELGHATQEKMKSEIETEVDEEDNEEMDEGSHKDDAVEPLVPAKKLQKVVERPLKRRRIARDLGAVGVGAIVGATGVIAGLLWAA